MFKTEEYLGKMFFEVHVKGKLNNVFKLAMFP